jgi:Protein of unknown function, DUF481
MRISILFTGILLLAGRNSAKSQHLKDTVFFNNGSVIVGKLKTIGLGIISFKPDDANEIKVQLRKLKTLYTTSRSYRLETVQHNIYYAQLLPSAEPGYVLLAGISEPAKIRLTDISGLMPLENTFLKKLTASIGAGYTYTRSSALGRLNLDGDLKYLAKDLELTLTASTIATIDSSTYRRDRENMLLQLNYFFSKRWFTVGLVNYQRNLELGIQRRFQQGIGLGNKFILKNNSNAWAIGGYVLNREKGIEAGKVKTLSELFTQLQFNFFRFSKPALDLNLRQTLYIGLAQNGRIRNDGQSILSWEIIDDLKIQISFYNNYDSDPPVTSNRKLDYGYVFGINYSFN